MRMGAGRTKRDRKIKSIKRGMRENERERERERERGGGGGGRRRERSDPCDLQRCPAKLSHLDRTGFA